MKNIGASQAHQNKRSASQALQYENSASQAPQYENSASQAPQYMYYMRTRVFAELLFNTIGSPSKTRYAIFLTKLPII
jgi:hypothetical protein